MYFIKKTTTTLYIKLYVIADLVKMDPVDEEILKTIKRVNVLLELNILAVRLRLVGMLQGLNKSMKTSNGNRKNLRVLYQNIPGTLSNENLVSTIESLLDRLDPDILAIAEPDTTDLDRDWGPYKLVAGENKRYQ